MESPKTPASTHSQMSSTSSVQEPATPAPSMKGKGSQKKKAKSRVLYYWSTEDTQRWLKKHCGQYFQLHGAKFVEHDINGRVLVNLSDVKLQKMGITDITHRDDMMRNILRLRLKTEAQEMKALGQKPLIAAHH